MKNPEGEAPSNQRCRRTGLRPAADAAKSAGRSMADQSKWPFDQAGNVVTVTDASIVDDGARFFS
jgi:hypothetical protein